MGPESHPRAGRQPLGSSIPLSRSSGRQATVTGFVRSDISLLRLASWALDIRKWAEHPPLSVRGGRANVEFHKRRQN